MKLIEYPDAEMMMMDLANRLAGELTNHLLRHDFASIAVPGGTTPGPMFDSLSAAALEWDRVRVMLTDERRVPATSPRSNERLVRQRLLTGPAAAARFVSYLPQGDIVGAPIGDLARLVIPELPLSIVVLGMGADMHTASIFPNSPDLTEALTTSAPLVAVQPPDGLEPRLSLSMAALTGAMACHILIIGPEKRAALDRALTLSPQEAPVAALLPHATVHWAES